MFHSSPKVALYCLNWALYYKLNVLLTQVMIRVSIMFVLRIICKFSGTLQLATEKI